MLQNALDIKNEALTAEAFGRQSVVFDEIYSPNLIIQYKRERVRSTINKYLTNPGKILELNAGTGEDAVYFARLGHTVHATDIADGMLEILQKKVNEHGLQQKITTEKCSYTSLQNLKNSGPYDLIFSNFAGLNCTAELDKVLLSFSPLLKKNGKVVLVIMPPFSIWETFLALQGQFKTAFRRFNSKNGRKAKVEGTYFYCWYYKPLFIEKTLKEEFNMLETEALCSIVPPSFFEGFPKKHPKLYKTLCRLENRFKSAWPWKNIGDYYIITLQKK